MKTERDGRSYRKPYHDALDLQRRQPGHCGRCGQLNPNGLRTCDPCLDYQRCYKAGLKRKPVAVDSVILDALTRRVASLELSVARLQVQARSEYKRGYRTGAAHERKARYIDFPTITKQELSTMNHAYCRP